ncbi:ead/Ea22-like family protein [Enterobacter hormaechei]|nr:ead/Ea22-like family protein [Enterobacter hormaechei]MDH1748432.1 ead/Ea22-like family protein [Enterobacter hormaechei]
MSNIDKRATELLIENGVLVADTLRHLADNEIDSDYFAICHTNENDTEIECELAITDYARQAAVTVDELVKALEAAEKRIAELEAREVVLPSSHDVHPLGPQSAKIFWEFHRSIVNRCADEIRKVGVKVSIKGN